MRNVRSIMLTRFIKYYKPHIWLFILDISTAIVAALLAMVAARSIGYLVGCVSSPRKVDNQK